MPVLPKYTDDENKFFHPLFREALDKALKNKSFGSTIDILEREKFGSSGIPDYMLFNKTTSKIDLVIEIKRTKSDVESIGTRRQAHSYVVNNLSRMSTPYYVITNLEILDLFLYHKSRPRINHQLLYPSPIIIGDLAIDKFSDFTSNLSDACEKLIDIIYTNKPQYISTLDVLWDLLKPYENFESEWHRHFMPFAYEYLRGKSKISPNIASALGSFKTRPAASFKGTVTTLQSIGKKVGLDKTFSDPVTESEDLTAFEHVLLESALSNGEERGRAEEIAELVNDIFSDRTALGIVETDQELSYLLVHLAGQYLSSFGDEILSNDIICDPAAGTGRLLNSAIERCFTHCQPNNFWANEIMYPFIETLELRLSLSLSETVTPSNKVKITNKNVIEFTESDFNTVKLILLNPPFISGVHSTKEKNEFRNRIHEETGIKSAFSKGQVGLEALFLEFIIGVVQPSTLVAVILPTNLLNRLSPEMIEFRKFLIEKFGLLAIITYPEEGLFEQSKKKTFIVIGRTGTANREIDWKTINYPLATVDFNKLDSYSTSDKILRSNLKINLSNGWSSPTKIRILNWFLKICRNKYHTMEELCSVQRGKLGNTGSSAICAISKSSSFFGPALKLPHRFAINNANTLDLNMSKSNAPCVSVIPDKNLAFSEQPEAMRHLITEFITQGSKRIFLAGSQSKKKKSTDEVLKAIIVSNNPFPANTILIPRAIRKEARVGELLEEYNVSTNFVGAICNDQTKVLRLKAYLFSVFGQIQMELLGINQEGMRKIEVEQVNRIIVPTAIFDSTIVKDKEITTALNSASPINFSSFNLRYLDKLFCKLIAADFDIGFSDVELKMQELIHERLAG